MSSFLPQVGKRFLLKVLCSAPSSFVHKLQGTNESGIKLRHVREFVHVQQLVPEPTVERFRQPFSEGAPGAMYRVLAPVHSSQRRSTRAMNSGPLSLRRRRGTPRTTDSATTSRTFSAVMLRATISTKHSRVYSFTIASHFNDRPLVVLVCPPKTGP